MRQAVSTTTNSSLVQWVGVFAAVALGLSACSLIIDVPADCDPEDCGGHRCNAEGTECLFVCLGSTDCVEGYVCDEWYQAGSCKARGCEPTGNSEVLFPNASATSQVSLAYNGTELGAAYIGNGTLYFQRFDNMGLAIGDPTIMNPGGAPEHPSLAWTDGVWSIAWQAVIEENLRTRQAIRYAAVGPQGALATAPTTVFTANLPGTDEVSATAPSIAWDAAAALVVLVWQTKVRKEEIWMLTIQADGTSIRGEVEVPREDARPIVTSEDEDSLSPTVAVRAPGVYDVTYLQGKAGLRLVLRTIDTAVNDLVGPDVDLSLFDGAESVDTYSYGLLAEGGAVALMTVSGLDITKSYRVQLDADRVIIGGSKLELGQGLRGTDDVSVWTDGSGYAAVFTSEYEDRNDVFFTRYDNLGAIEGHTFPVSSNEEVDVPRFPETAATPDGFLTYYQPTEGSNVGKIVGRFWTCN